MSDSVVHGPRDPQHPTRLTPEGYLAAWDADLGARVLAALAITP